MEDRLHKFAYLVETGSFTKAAGELHISQPALSVAIAKLERELHHPLLVRGARTLTLTPAGHLAYKAAKELQTTAGNLKVRLAELDKQELVISIGMIDSIANGLFTDAALLDNLERQARLSIIVDNSRRLQELVTRDQLDIAYIVQQPVSPTGLQTQYIGSEPLLFVCHTNQLPIIQPAVHQGTVPRFISYDQTSTSYQHNLASLKLHHITPHSTFHSTSPDVMLRLVLLQKGAALLPYLLVHKLISEGTLSVLSSKQGHLLIERPIQQIIRRGKELPLPLMQVKSSVETSLKTQQWASKALARLEQA